MSSKQSIIVFLIISFFFFGCKSTENLQPDGEFPRVENVRFNQQSDTVDVYYDLLAKSSDSRFNVQLLLSFGPDKTFEIAPPAASGHIGEGVPPGKHRKISWKVLRDFPHGLNGENVQFMVNAERIGSGKKSWLYITAGALLVGAGTAAAMLLTGESTVPLPSPPTRPNGNN